MKGNTDSGRCDHGGTSTSERNVGRTAGRLPRRALIGAAGSLMTAQLPPFEVDPAQAAPPVTRNPIPTRIRFGSLRLSLQDFCTPPGRASRPRAMLNFLYHAGDGSGRLFAADSRGKLWAISAGGTATLFLDLLALRGPSIVIENSTKYLGLRTFAFHPDFARSGRPGFRKLYTVNTETPASAPDSVPVLGDPALPLYYHDVIAEWQASASGSTVDPGSRREVLRIRQWNRGHNTDQLMFNPNLTPGSFGYGLMYVTIGDGKNSPAYTDPYDLAQDRRSPLGKVLRINPLQRGALSYTVPSGNPFVGQADLLPEIWALGFRHPEFLCFDTAGSKQMVIASVGQDQIEAIYLGARGANCGWPLREGTFLTNRSNENVLYPLPADDASFGFEYPVAQYDHDEGVAICGGFVYRGTDIPALVGHYLFGDIVSGRVFSVPVASMRRGSQATIQEVRLLRGGSTVTLRGLLRTSGRVDLRFGQDQAGEMYLTTKQDGIVRKLAAA